jgi:hypothetical protein
MSERYAVWVLLAKGASVWQDWEMVGVYPSEDAATTAGASSCTTEVAPWVKRRRHGRTVLESSAPAPPGDRRSFGRLLRIERCQVEQARSRAGRGQGG